MSTPTGDVPRPTPERLQELLDTISEWLAGPGDLWMQYAVDELVEILPTLIELLKAEAPDGQ